MQHSAKYLIHAEIRTDGVVERSDVVGAVFGQTEGLLGEDLDLRQLQDSSKVGRIDVDIDSEGGRSYGTITVASALDRVETSVLAASFETITRVGPSRAECTVVDIEDVRAAKREDLVDRASELLAQFEETAITGDSLVEEVRQRARAEAITEFASLPAGPRVESSDAIIVVEGRADVRQLLEYGIKNAIAVEGTDIPDAVVQLTTERTTTAFLDGDRGGDLIVQELEQVGDLDYVAFAPADTSVEDLDRATIKDALRRKIPVEQVTGELTPRQAFEPDSTTESSSERPSTVGSDISDEGQADSPAAAVAEPGAPGSQLDAEVTEGVPESEATASPGPERGVDNSEHDSGGTVSETDSSQLESESIASTTGNDTATVDETTPAQDSSEETSGSAKGPETLAGHVAAVIDEGTDLVRVLDSELSILAERPIDETVEVITESEQGPRFVVLDAPVSQRILDVSAQREVGQIVGTDTEEFVKQPTSVLVRTAEEFA